MNDLPPGGAPPPSEIKRGNHQKSGHPDKHYAKPKDTPPPPPSNPAARSPTGLSLLDWFAGQAVQGCVYEAANYQPGEGVVYVQAAQMAYKFAEALMAERERREREAGTI